MMWGWIGEVFKWLGARGSNSRLDFELITQRWQALYEKTAERQTHLENELESLRKSQAAAIEIAVRERDECREKLALQGRKLIKTEGKLEDVGIDLAKALDRIEALEKINHAR